MFYVATVKYSMVNPDALLFGKIKRIYECNRRIVIVRQRSGSDELDETYIGPEQYDRAKAAIKAAGHPVDKAKEIFYPEVVPQ